MRLHRRKNVRKIWKFCGEIFLNKKVYGVTAGCDDNVPVFFVYHALIFVFNDSRADSRFLCIKKSELFERFAHRFDTNALVICNERRSEADNDRGI